MFESMRVSHGLSPDGRVVVGIVSVLYVTALTVFLVAGPFLLSGLGELSLGAAFEMVIGIVGVGYALAGALLLR